MTGAAPATTAPGCRWPADGDQSWAPAGRGGEGPPATDAGGRHGGDPDHGHEHLDGDRAGQPARHGVTPCSTRVAVATWRGRHGHPAEVEFEGPDQHDAVHAVPLRVPGRGLRGGGHAQLAEPLDAGDPHPPGTISRAGNPWSSGSGSPFIPQAMRTSSSALAMGRRAADAPVDSRRPRRTARRGPPPSPGPSSRETGVPEDRPAGARRSHRATPIDAGAPLGAGPFMVLLVGEEPTAVAGALEGARGPAGERLQLARVYVASRCPSPVTSNRQDAASTTAGRVWLRTKNRSLGVRCGTSPSHTVSTSVPWWTKWSAPRAARGDLAACVNHTERLQLNHVTG